MRFDALSRVEGRVRQIQTLLGETDRSNKDFGEALARESVRVDAAPPADGGAPAMARAAGDVASHVREAAARTGLPEELIHAVIGAESGYRPGAVSPVGAAGLMQLMPDTARALGVRDRFDERQNILGGSEYLRQQLARFGTVEKALAAYNAGPGAVERHGGIPPYRETERYVKRVLSKLQSLRDGE